MRKRLDIIFYIVIPTIVAYTTFFLIYYFYRRLFFEYRWLAIMPFVIVTAFFIKDNIREWKEIKQHS